MRGVSCLLLGLLFCHSPAYCFYESVRLPNTEAESQSVVTAGSDAYVFTLTEDGKRGYQRFRAATGYQVADISKPLADDIVFVDTARIADDRRVVLISRHHAQLLDDQGEPEKPFLEFASMYTVPVHNRIPEFDLFRDVNGDGLDDFVVAGFDGYQIAIQGADGSFGRLLEVNAAPLMDMSFRDHPWYQARNLLLADMNLDGREDIVFWIDNNFVIYPQQSDGQFSATAIMQPCLVELDFDGVDALSVRLRDEDQSNVEVTVLHGLEDFNDDQIPDLLTMTVKSSGVFNKQTTFALHYGRKNNQGFAVFERQPDTSIQSKGIQYEMEIRDLDRDGQQDMMVSSIELGVGKIIAALLTNAIKIELGFYRMENGQYPEKPNTNHHISATFSLSSGEFWEPAVLLLDANNDGLEDLLVQQGDEQLDIFVGIATDKLFSDKAVSIATSLPKDPRLISTALINSDEIPDIVVRVPPALGSDSKQYQILLLLSQGANATK